MFLTSSPPGGQRHRHQRVLRNLWRQSSDPRSSDHQPCPPRTPSTGWPPPLPSRSTAPGSGRRSASASQRATSASSPARAGRRCWWGRSGPWPARPGPTRGWTRLGTARRARRQARRGSVCTRANPRLERLLTRPLPHLSHPLCLPLIDWRWKILAMPWHLETTTCYSVFSIQSQCSISNLTIITVNLTHMMIKIVTHMIRCRGLRTLRVRPTHLLSIDHRYHCDDDDHDDDHDHD